MAIKRAVGGVNVSFTLTIDGVPVNYESINGIELELSENKHDMLTLLVTGLPPRAVTEYRNRGVEFTMHTGGGYYEYFCGYVVSVNPTQEVSKGIVNNSPFQVSEVVCLGASYMMRSKNSMLWSDTSLTYVTESIARKHGLSSVAPNVTPIARSIVQDSESDWQFLVRLAGIYGYRVNCHGTHITVYHPREAGNRLQSFNRLLTQRVTGTATTQAGQIIEFHGKFLDQRADGIYKDASVTVLQDNGVAFDVTTKEVLNTGTRRPVITENLSEVVHTYDKAAKLLESKAFEDYDYEAKIVVVGVAGAKPGGLVFVDNYNAEYDGYWYVSGVKHEVFQNGMFVSTLCVHKSVNYVYDMTPKPLGAAPQSLFIDGKWTTSKRLYRAY